MLVIGLKRPYEPIDPDTPIITALFNPVTGTLTIIPVVPYTVSIVQEIAEPETDILVFEPSFGSGSAETKYTRPEVTLVPI